MCEESGYLEAAILRETMWKDSLFCLGNGDESKQYSFYIVNNARPVKGERVSFLVHVFIS